MSSDRAPALVTGGAGGIGRAVCAALAAQGRPVAVADVDVDRARDVADEIGGLAVALDVTDEESVEAAVGTTWEGVGPIGLLVSCAGWDELRPFVETDEAFSRRVVEINLMGTIRVNRSVLRRMVAEDVRGRVVNIASDAARVGSPLESIYSAAKGGVIALTKTLAREMARRQITVNCVCPGPTDTPLVRAMVETGGEKLIDSLCRAIPLGRIAEPTDIVGSIVFLGSDAAAFITGQTLSVSGGLTMA